MGSMSSAASASASSPALVLSSLLLLLSLSVSPAAAAFNHSTKNNFVLYWGQGYVPESKADVPLRDWCNDTTFTIIQIAFLQSKQQPYLDCAQCWKDQFPGTSIPKAYDIGDDIMFCQEKGIDIGLAYGGDLNRLNFTNQTEAEDFAVLVWDMFFGGYMNTRPFGNAVLNGFDFDLEIGIADPNTIFFANKLRALMDADKNRTYWMSAVPQCSFRDITLGPDGLGSDGSNITGSLLGHVPMDFVSIQFYNNLCEFHSLDSGFGFTVTYQKWHDWAVTQTLNPHLKLIVGYLARTGFSSRFINKQLATVDAYSSFGGFMQWCASEIDSDAYPEVKTYLNAVNNITDVPSAAAPQATPFLLSLAAGADSSSLTHSPAALLLSLLFALSLLVQVCV